jgi:hypothetical protein
MAMGATIERAETGHRLRFQIEPSRGHLFDSGSGLPCPRFTGEGFDLPNSF